MPTEPIMPAAPTKPTEPAPAPPPVPAVLHRPDLSPPPDDGLYVNYRPLPPRDRRFIRVLVPAALWLMAALAFLWARAQNYPGPAVWDDAHARVFEGWLVARPYPILYANDTGAGSPGPMLLVGVGKRAAPDGVTALDGQFVRLQGWLLQRDGRTMLELDPDFQQPGPAPAADRPTPPPLGDAGPVTLRGEIVDAKCYLGAMKPGDGKAHKACATLCIKGGLPPMLVVKGAGPARAPSYYLLRVASNATFHPSSSPVPAADPADPDLHLISDLIGEPVEVTGDVQTWGDLFILTMRRGGARRL